MKDDYKGQTQIYQYFSDCLRIFKKRILLLCKISSSNNDQQISRLSQTLDQIMDEGVALLNKFQQIQQDNSNIQIIFSRFLLRVKESVHTISLMPLTSQIGNFLKFLENLVKDFNFSTNIRLLLKIILTKIPKNNFNNNVIAQVKKIRRNSSDHTLSTIKPQGQKQNSKSSAHFDSYDKYLQALDRQYRLFDCLNIFKSDYRRTFFLALEDFQKKDNNLLEQMLYRNRFTKQSLQLYQKHYEKQKKKLLQKKTKNLKTKANTQMEEYQQKQTYHRSIIFKLRQKSYESSENKTLPKRIKSQFYSKNQVRTQNEIIVNNFEGRNLKNLKERLKTSYARNSEQFNLNQALQQERRSIPKNTFAIPLKKVHFKGGKIELVPQKQKKNQQRSEQQRRRNFYKKTQQHFRKKISIINQNRKPKLQQVKQDQIPERKQTFKSIRIQFNKIIH